MTTQITKWYPPHIKPVRVGIYQTRVGKDSGIFYSYWNGIDWSVGLHINQLTPRRRMIRGIFQDKQWRGLTKETVSNIKEKNT